MIVRPLKDTDYETLCVFWKDWNMEPPLKDFLPQNGEGGIMVMDGEEPICAGFMYATNSKVAWVDWIVSSKTYRKKPQRKEAIELLITTLTTIAKNLGYVYAYSLTDNKILENTFEKLGYTKGIKYSKELICKIN